MYNPKGQRLSAPPSYVHCLAQSRSSGINHAITMFKMQIRCCRRGQTSTGGGGSMSASQIHAHFSFLIPHADTVQTPEPSFLRRRKLVFNQTNQNGC